MTNSTATLTLLLLEKERRARRKARELEKASWLSCLSYEEFAGKTRIKAPLGRNADDFSLVPFNLWPFQRDTVLPVLQSSSLITILKARQLGISWLVALYTLKQCLSRPGYEALFLSRGKLEAQELISRVSLLYHKHEYRDRFPRLVTDNKGQLIWDNGSNILSLASTEDAGRSFTFSQVFLDEWAFMKWPQTTLQAVKPTVDAGGQLMIASTADGLNSHYHRHCVASRKGSNGYHLLFLPWFFHPDRDETWRERKIVEASGDYTSVYREYPENLDEAFIGATGRVYAVWSDGPGAGNVTEEADYVPDGGPVYWALDDGYEGKWDSETEMYTADSHPRVILFIQERADGTLCIFDESYAVKTLSEEQLNEAKARPYAPPQYCAIDKSAAELRGRLQAMGYYTWNGPASVDESIKFFRSFIAPDQEHGRRRLKVHPRCHNFRQEMASYRYDEVKGVPIKAFDHGPDAGRYFAWTKREG